VILARLRAKGMIPKGLPLAVIVTAILFTAGFGRLVQIVGDQGSETLWLWAWQKGSVSFINSVTGRPVEIRFQIPWHFSWFSAQTDSGTEEYYTAGEYRWDRRLAQEHKKRLQYCSEVGITMILGGYVFRVRGGCLQASLVWPF
jgi:hypothetical protein